MGKTTVNVYRFFDQEVVPGIRPYKRIKQKLTKTEAKSLADKARRAGAKARVVKEADGYVLFVLARRSK